MGHRRVCETQSYIMLDQPDLSPAYQIQAGGDDQLHGDKPATVARGVTILWMPASTCSPRYSPKEDSSFICLHDFTCQHLGPPTSDALTDSQLRKGYFHFLALDKRRACSCIKYQSEGPWLSLDNPNSTTTFSFSSKRSSTIKSLSTQPSSASSSSRLG